MPISAASLSALRAAIPRGEHRFVVTGVAGFIGSNLLETLLRLGHHVVGIDSFVTGRRSILKDVQGSVTAAEWSRFRFVEGDIRDPATCNVVCAGAEYVLHQAAIGSVPRSIENPQATNASNIDGFLNVLVAARDAKVKRFVYAASSSTYGDSEELPKVEERIGRPLSPYAVTKLVNELYADVFARTYGMNVIGLRYFNVFGPRQDPAGAYAAVIPKWIDMLLRGLPCVINGDGETTRDFCYIDNVIQANLRAAFVEQTGSTNQVYNVAVGGRATLNDLHAAICEALSKLVPNGSRIAAARPQYGPFRQGDVRHSQASIEKARRLLGYEPTHDLRRGLDEAMPWYVHDLTTTT